MKRLGLNEIREEYLKFFESKGHLRLPSFSLVPINDPSLLLINSGMAPLKNYFTGVEEPPRKRVTTCQKCIRTPDIENVGKTARHGTFFEMLGNFSFGDYFKKEAIAWAWEFFTEVMEIPADKLWITIYEDDDEAHDIWVDNGISPDRIVRMGKEDNFWEHGTGPCGPCSELHYDRGPENGCGKPDCKIGCDCDRFVEVWNLVFTQFFKDEEGNYSKLKNPNIDTGMGLERLACVMQDVDNLFEVDTIRNVLNKVCDIAGIKYKTDAKSDVSIRVVTDHIRSTVMMVSDGVIPSNEGRGYVLRRLLRRAARHGKLLGINNIFLSQVAEVVIAESKEAYPELVNKADYIKAIINAEEEKFNTTIDQGLKVLEDYMADSKLNNNSVLAGELAFKLHDTYGFPIDLTLEIAKENDIQVDEAGYKKAMDNQRNMARDAIKDRMSSWGSKELHEGIDKEFKTEFLGYNMEVTSANVAYILQDDALVDSLDEGAIGTVILDKTTIYAESGGQVGDSGTISSPDGLVAKVIDSKKTADGKFLHVVEIESGTISVNDNVDVSYDRNKRRDTARNHTATHLLQKALQHVLGPHVTQAGSSVDSERLRFDFNHFQGMTKEEIKRVENEVNDVIYADLNVSCTEMSLDEAKKQGAMALFSEKYGDIVRVVKAGDYSMELCGGTHVPSTGKIFGIKIVSESAVAAGVRRIEALTGRNLRNYFNEKEEILNKVSDELKTNPHDVLKRIEQINEEIKHYKIDIAELNKKISSSSIDELLSNIKDINDTKVIAAKMDGLDPVALREIGDKLRDKLGQSGAVVLFSPKDDKVNIVAMAGKEAVKKGFHSGNIVKKVANILGGGGGGRPDMAQAGGKDSSKIDEAIDLVYNAVKDFK